MSLDIGERPKYGAKGAVQPTKGLEMIFKRLCDLPIENGFGFKGPVVATAKIFYLGVPCT